MDVENGRWQRFVQAVLPASTVSALPKMLRPAAKCAALAMLVPHALPQSLSAEPGLA